MSFLSTRNSAWMFLTAIAGLIAISFFGDFALRSLALGLVILTLLMVVFSPEDDRRSHLLVLSGIILYGLIVRLAYVLSVNEMPFSDMADQETIALQILQGKFDSGHHPFFRSFLPHGTAYYVALVYWLFGAKNLLALRLCNVVLAVAANICIFNGGKHIAGVRTGLVAAFLWAFSQEMVFWSGKLSTEHFLACVGVLSIYFLARLWKERRMWLAVANGISLGYFYFSKSVIQVPLLLVAGAGIFLWRGKKSDSVKLVAVASASFVIVLLPWVIRNYHLYGVITTTPTGGWYSMHHQANDVVRPGSHGGQELQTQIQDFAEKNLANDYEGAQWAKRGVVEWIKHHKRRYVKLCLGRVYLLLWENGIHLTLINPYNLSFLFGAKFPLLHWNFGAYPFVVWITIIAMIALLPRCIELWRSRDSDQLVLIFLPMIFFFGISLFYILVLAFPRYRDPQLPFAYLMCGVGIAEFARCRKKRIAGE